MSVINRLLVLIAVSLSSGPLHAADLAVPAEYATIQGALDVAVDGDVILIAPGTYDGSFSTLGKAVTLRGTGGAAVTRLTTPQSSGPLATLPAASSAVTLDRVTFFNFSNTALSFGSGAEVVLSGCVFFNIGGDPEDRLGEGDAVTLTLDGCDIIGCTAWFDLSAGILTVQQSGFRNSQRLFHLTNGSAATVSDSEFYDHRVGTTAKTLFLVEDSQLLVSDSTFARNVSRTGSCFQLTQSSLQIDDSSFIDNDADEVEFGLNCSGSVRGGVILSESDSQVVLNRTSFIGCDTRRSYVNCSTIDPVGCGGVAWIETGSLSVNGCTIQDSDPVGADLPYDQGRFGGAVYARNAQVHVSGTTFANCGSTSDTSSAVGGAMFVDGGSLNMDSVVFSNCLSFSGSGAVFVLASDSLELNSVTFQGCRIARPYQYSSVSATALAVRSVYTPIKLHDCEFNECSMIWGGDDNRTSAVSCDGCVELEVTGSRFEGCRAVGSGAIRFEDTLSDVALVSIGDSAFINCKSGNTNGTQYANNGGAVEVILSTDGSSLEIDGCLFQNCQLSNVSGIDGGGAVYLRHNNGTLCRIENSQFLNCSSLGDNGGAILSERSFLSVDRCFFSNNQGELGDSIYASTSGSEFTAVTNSTFSGPVYDELVGNWIDKGGNVFDAGGLPDCDGNGFPDSYEIAAGTALDCNLNGLPDACESLGDCDGDGILDVCAIADGASDCDGNGLPDVCQADCDGDGIPDVCAIAKGALDCDDNGVPDACQIASGLLQDVNNDGVPDSCQVLDFTGLVTEIVPIEDRILDSTVPATAVCFRLYAEFDLTSIGAASLLGVYGDAKTPLVFGSPAGFWQDPFGGNPSAGVPCDDVLAFPDLRYDSWLTIERLCVLDNVLFESGIDWTEFASGGSLQIADGGVFVSPDDAQSVVGLDGRILIAQLTSTDGTLPTGSLNLVGQNADGSDWQAFGVTWPEAILVDCNDNGIHDAYDISSGSSRDCNGSGIPDECEYDTINDCNGNGIDDLCDVADGTSGDADGDFVPDECECSGDATRDGIVNVDDIIAVILAWGSNDPDADIDGNGIVDATDLVLVLGGYGSCL